MLMLMLMWCRPGAAQCELAHFSNVHAKITFCHVASRQRYPHADTHPLVHQLMDAFGADRCLWGSNFTGECAVHYDACGINRSL